MRKLFLCALVTAGCGGPMTTPDAGAGADASGIDASGIDAAGTDASFDAATASDGGAPGALADVHLLGRFDLSDPSAPRFAWPGTTIRTRFEGTELSVELDDSGSNLFEVIVDGVAQDPLQTTGGRQTYVLARDLTSGPHDVSIARRTESFFGATRFHGFSGSPLVETPAPTRWIEMVGDSITCGYGVLGPDENCGFSADTEAETYAWGALAAQELGAAHTAIAYSGQGMVRDGDGNTTDPMPVRFARTIADEPSSQWTFTGYTPDVVVVNLGTNDFATGDPGQAYVDAYVAFVAQLRGHYPQAWILVAESSMLGDGYPPGEMHRTRARAHLEAVVSRAADARVVLLPIAEQSASDSYGCDWHPSRPTQEIMADALVARVRALTGW